MKRSSVKALTHCALCCAVCAICAQIAVPFGALSFTMQTFAVALCGCFLGPTRAVITVCVYLALGALGAPIFAHFQGGFHLFFTAHGGFLVGFLPLAFLCGFVSSYRRLWIGALGLIACHLLGVAWYAYLTATPIGVAFLWASAPFLLKDAVSVFAGFALSRKMLHAQRIAL